MRGVDGLFLPQRWSVPLSWFRILAPGVSFAFPKAERELSLVYPVPSCCGTSNAHWERRSLHLSEWLRALFSRERRVQETPRALSAGASHPAPGCIGHRAFNVLLSREHLRQVCREAPVSLAPRADTGSPTLALRLFICSGPLSASGFPAPLPPVLGCR